MDKGWAFRYPLSLVRFDLAGAPCGHVSGIEARGRLKPEHVLQRDVLRSDEGAVPEGYALPELLVLLFSSAAR